MLKIFGAPSRYVQGPDALSGLGAFAARLGRRAVVVSDPLVGKMIGERVLRLCAEEQVDARISLVEGEVTHQKIAAVVESVRAHAPDLVIAAGGGKSIDIGKAVANALKTRLITVPTVASNDSPTSKNYVIYDDRHQLVAVEHLPFDPDYVVVDTLLLSKAPKHLFLAGIGDAISKKFEAEQAFAAGGANMFGEHSTLAAQLLADGCYRILRADAAAALDCAGSGSPTPAFERAVEATLLLSGLGFESGGLSIAHALTRGWPAVPGVAAAMHGLQVAFGLLIQLTLEKRDDAIVAELAEWYRTVGLPRSLADLGAAEASQASLLEAAERTLTAPHVRNFKRALSAAELAACLDTFRHATPI
ncbi:glycerol dehydrogenase [Bosea sp. NBC_00550]|uniref:glycerol dehydrogenase n=1 Tax=Bosea sp. NBC_00550 TaxID=2969621 RepID=UPI00222F8416|nr:glycerol dehydrogenase [Bosea sp. NBC_00550]UZF90599.1 glycerol dehydrogenase [Bosea sp. NBC_00550]